MGNAKLHPMVQEFHTKSRGAKNLILLDRDGTLNYDSGYTYKVKDLIILPHNVELIKGLLDKKSSIACITNQSGIGRGYFSAEEAKIFNRALHKKLCELGLLIDIFYICPHIPELNCPCRKPGTLMLEMALRLSKIPIEKSVFVGDSITDEIACRKLGIKYIQVVSNSI